MPKICVTFYLSTTSPKLTELVAYSIALSRRMPVLSRRVPEEMYRGNVLSRRDRCRSSAAWPGRPRRSPFSSSDANPGCNDSVFTVLSWGTTALDSTLSVRVGGPDPRVQISLPDLSTQKRGVDLRQRPNSQHAFCPVSPLFAFSQKRVVETQFYYAFYIRNYEL